MPPNPGDFVGSQPLADILEDLRQRVDIVLIDSPPILNIGDAMMLGARVDALIIVANVRLLRRQLLRELRRVLDVSPTAKLGFVVTGAPVGDAYGYGYGGYGYERKSKPGKTAERTSLY